MRAHRLRDETYQLIEPAHVAQLATVRHRPRREKNRILKPQSCRIHRQAAILRGPRHGTPRFAAVLAESGPVVARAHAWRSSRSSASIASDDRGLPSSACAYGDALYAVSTVARHTRAESGVRSAAASQAFGASDDVGYVRAARRNSARARGREPTASRATSAARKSEAPVLSCAFARTVARRSAESTGVSWLPDRAVRRARSSSARASASVTAV